MADVVTYCVNGQPILNGGAVVHSDKLGNVSYIGPTGIHGATASAIYTALETQYSGKFDDPRYYTGDAST